MKSGKKPVYKKWWFWLIAVLAVLTIYGAIEGVNQAKEQTEKDKSVPIEKKEEPQTETVEADNEPEDEEETNIIEYDEQFLFGEFTVENMRTEINDNELTFKFDWINQSGRKTPFIALGYFDVMQGEEILEEVSGAYAPGGNSLLQRQTDNGVTVPGEATYKIVSDEPIEIKFGATHEIDDTKEKLIIEIE